MCLFIVAQRERTQRDAVSSSSSNSTKKQWFPTHSWRRQWRLRVWWERVLVCCVLCAATVAADMLLNSWNYLLLLSLLLARFLSIGLVAFVVVIVVVLVIGAVTDCVIMLTAAELSASGLAWFKQLDEISILFSSLHFVSIFPCILVVVVFLNFFFICSSVTPTAKLRFRFRDYMVLTRRSSNAVIGFGA